MTKESIIAKIAQAMETTPDQLRTGCRTIDRDARRMAIAILFETGVCGLGEAGDIAGIQPRSIHDNYVRHKYYLDTYSDYRERYEALKCEIDRQQNLFE